MIVVPPPSLLWSRLKYLYRILLSYGSDYEDYYLLGCDPM
jgi:hypothetical protein